MRKSTTGLSALPYGKPNSARGIQRVGAFVKLPTLLRELGADPARVLADAGLSVDALVDAESTIPYAALGRLLNSAVERTGCAHFGLLAGRAWHLSDMGLPGLLMRNSATVGDALHRLLAFHGQNSSGMVPYVREAGSVVDFGCAIYEPGMLGIDQAADMYLAGGVNFLRELCGPDWAPSAILLPHSRPANTLQHRHFFRLRPSFNAEICAIRFSANWMQAQVAGANAERLRSELARCSRMNYDIVQAVRRTLRIVLLEGRCAGDEVAGMLGMHRRTLNRRLKDAGTTFQAQLDFVRVEVARQLLARSDLTLDDLSAALGYSQISSFMRSCKRWTGATPTQWRRLARNDEHFSPSISAGRGTASRSH